MELEEYSSLLTEKAEIVVGSKADITGYEKNLQSLERYLKKKICAVSAVTGKNLETLLVQLRRHFQ